MAEFTSQQNGTSIVKSVPLRTNTELMELAGSHGLKPFDYLIEFISDPNPTSFADPESGAWQYRVAKLDSVSLGYGAEDGHCARFTMWDPNSVENAVLPNIDFTSVMAKPTNGEVVRIWLFDPTHPGGQVIFKGTIRAVHERKTDTGVEWNAEAISEITRLNDVHVTFAANYFNDPINPQPHFDAAGNMVLGRLKTVAELVNEVMNFRDAWGTVELFNADSIEWHGLDTDPKCGAFVPSTVTFQDTPKGQAIRDLLQRAGNFTYFYEPRTNKIHIVEINLRCDKCGPQWFLPFVDSSAFTAATGKLYASDFAIIEDNTDWSTKDTYNVCRITGGMIRFFSGSYVIPERLDGADPNTDDAISALLNDTVNQQKARAYSPDRVFYRFSTPSQTTNDARKRKRYFVGMPLFPDWNIHEDYLPTTFQIIDAIMPSTPVKDKTNKTWAQSDFAGQIELNSETIGDACARGEPRLNHLDNLHAYQAWYAPDVCPACEGSGLVKYVYTDTQAQKAAAPGVEHINEPDIEYKVVGTGDQTRLVPRVTNYIFDPSKFGTGASPDGLEPYDTLNENSYPVPWKNLCPYCRGIGLKPEYKIRNINRDLYAGRNNQIPQTDTKVEEVPMDPDATAIGPETWEQAQSRIVMRGEVNVQVETALDTIFLPKWDHRNKPFNKFHNIATNNSVNQNERINKFAHPLNFHALRRRFAGIMNVDRNDTRAKLAQADWSCEVPFTTIVPNPPQPRIDYDMGRVIFDRPIFVPCRKNYTQFLVLDGKKVKIDSNGLLQTRQAGRGFVTAGPTKPTGYWRPARVWMTCFYSRENYFRTLDKDQNGNSISETRITTTTAENELQEYIVRSAIIAGQWAAEVKKARPDTDAGGNPMEFDTGNRILQFSMSEENTKIETTEKDLYRMPAPPSIDMSKAEFEAYKTNAGLDFPRARILRMMRTTPGEIMWEAEGYDAKDYNLSIVRPKVFSFGMRDDRIRLLNLAIRRLESNNNLLVSGTLVIAGIANDFSGGNSFGLGWVYYPNRGKAAIRRITYNLRQGFTTELELTREEARFGELPPKAEEMQNALMKDLLKYKRIAELSTGGNNSNMLHLPNDNTDEASDMFARGGG